MRLNLVRHGDKTRARQTAELLGSVLETGGEINPAEDLGPNDAPEVFLERLQSIDENTLIAWHLICFAGPGFF